MFAENKWKKNRSFISVSVLGSIHYIFFPFLPASPLSPPTPLPCVGGPGEGGSSVQGGPGQGGRWEGRKSSLVCFPLTVSGPGSSVRLQTHGSREESQPSWPQGLSSLSKGQFSSACRSGPQGASFPGRRGGTEGPAEREVGAHLPHRLHRHPQRLPQTSAQGAGLAAPLD